MDNNIRLTYWDNYGMFYCLFDKNGTILFKDILTKDNEKNISNFDNLSYSELLKIHENESLNGYYTRHILLRHRNKTQLIDVISFINDIYDKRDWEYEYIECARTTNKPFEIAFIINHTSYGVQGVKILNFNSSFDLKIIYEMDNLRFDGAFHNLTFNSIGDKYSLLLYNYDYLTICEYSIGKNIRSINEFPLKMFKTNFGYFKYGPLNMEYLNDKILCIARNSDFIVFDLNTGKVIEVINRDSGAPYLITINSLKNELLEKKYLKE